MRAIRRVSCLMCTAAVGSFAPAMASAEVRAPLAEAGSNAEKREDPPTNEHASPRWNTSFVFGVTNFRDSEPHRCLGASLRVRLARLVSVEPEFLFMDLPDRVFESTVRRTVTKHSDLMVGGRMVYDFRDPTRTSVIPYITGGPRGYRRDTSGGRRRNRRATASPSSPSLLPVR